MMSTGAFAPCLGPVPLQSQPRSVRAMGTYVRTLQFMTSPHYLGAVVRIG